MNEKKTKTGANNKTHPNYTKSQLKNHSKCNLHQNAPLVVNG